MGMFNLALAIAPRLAGTIDLSGRKRLLDLGGGPGTYAVQFCLANPELTASVFDLATSQPFAASVSQRFGVASRVDFVPGDYLMDPVPGGYDVVWLSQILHAEGPEDCLTILRKAAGALNPGGLLFVHEFLLDDTMDGPEFAALFSLNMLLGTAHGQAYTEGQVSEMLARSGVRDIKRLDFTGPNDSRILCGMVDETTGLVTPRRPGCEKRKMPAAGREEGRDAPGGRAGREEKMPPAAGRGRREDASGGRGDDPPGPLRRKAERNDGQGKAMARTLTFDIFRHNPADRKATPHMDRFTLDETERMTLFIALTRIREECDPSLAFDFCCRAGICGSCAMVINGRPGLACHTKTRDLPGTVTLLPLPFFPLVGDLSVDTGGWFRDMYQRVESWVHTQQTFDPEASEQRMDNALAEEIYELDRCIECGCCLAACGTALLRPDYLGAAGLNRLARFMLDPRDERGQKAYFDLVGTDEGIFGCMGLLGCEDVCPKGIPLQEQLGKLRRKMALAALKDALPRFFRKD